ncbi:hypothetical protein [Cyanobium sp. ATX-6F1]|uniref:hypothetical protein n=1 Tax=Cyanobium sp. ATX-6F1 TaxID=3137388 RepID=UPI0039BDDBA0
MQRPTARLLLSALLLMGFAGASAAEAATPKTTRRGPAAAAKTTPLARYRISAETTTARTIKMPSLGQMMGGGSVSFSTETNRSLLLRLQSPAPQPPHPRRSTGSLRDCNWARPCPC